MKDPFESCEPVRVTSPEVADMLRQVGQVQRLRHFMTPAGSTVSAFARAFGLTDVQAYRQVKTFERLGLLHVTRLEKRAGRDIRWYICPARRYLLPLSLVSLEEYLHQSFQPYEGQLKARLAAAGQGEHGVAGLLVGAAREEGVMLVPADAAGQPWSPEGPGAPAVFMGIGPLYLDYAQAKALQAELYDLFGRYGQAGGAGRYVYQAILTPFEG